jgi:hypothetical protein
MSTILEIQQDDILPIDTAGIYQISIFDDLLSADIALTAAEPSFNILPIEITSISKSTNEEIAGDITLLAKDRTSEVCIDDPLRMCQRHVDDNSSGHIRNDDKATDTADMKINVPIKQYGLVLGAARNRCYYILGLLHKMNDTKENIDEPSGCIRDSVLDRVSIYSGGSDAAVISLLLCCGFTPAQIGSAFVDYIIFDEPTDESKFINIASLLRAILTPMLLDQFGVIPSLQQLFTLTGKTLYISAYNLTNQCVDYISHITHPYVECITACSWSFNMPHLYYRQSYCGTSYVDSSYYNPLSVPTTLTESGDNIDVICIYIGMSNNDLLPEERLNMECYYRYLLAGACGILADKVADTLPSTWNVIKFETTFPWWTCTKKDKLRMMIDGSL